MIFYSWVCNCDDFKRCIETLGPSWVFEALFELFKQKIPCWVISATLSSSSTRCFTCLRYKKLSLNTQAADASAQSGRVVVVGVIHSRRGVHNVELLSWEQPGFSQCNGKCKIYLCSSRAVSPLTCSEGTCSLYRGNK